MKTLEQLNAEIKTCSDKMQAILDASDKAGGKLSAEQKSDYDALEKQCDGLIAEKQELLDAADRRKKLAERAQQSANIDTALASAPRRTQVESLTPTIPATPREDLSSYTLSTGEVVQRTSFQSLGHQLQAIANVATSGRDDNRLIWEQLAPAGAAAGVPSDGGYLIQKDFVTSLSNLVTATAILRPRTRTIPIGANSDGLKLTTVDEASRATGSRWGGVQVYWGAEADAATAKKPKFRQMELELKDLIGLAYATNRLLADASALGAVFSMAFSEEMAFAVDDAIISGTGSGQPLGILNSGAVVSVAKETGQAAATILFENVNKMWSRLWARSRATAVWLINQDCEPQLNLMTLPVGTGGVPVYMPPGGASTSPYSTLFGRPVIPTEYNATCGTTGDIMLVDLNQYLMITKGGMQADESIHVRFTTNENTFRFIYRTDGQPVWRSALTPYKGSATQSPFVKLDTRA